MVLVASLVGLFVCICTFVGAFLEQYSVVIDAGSTGSRAFVFHRSFDTQSNAISIVSTKGLKVTPGLSSFSESMHNINGYLIPVLEDAMIHVPHEFRANTTINMLGTAGMRLLTNDMQENIWYIVRHSILEHLSFIQSDNVEIRTLDGLEEAYYGALSANYVMDRIDAQLNPLMSSLIGSLDMGGSSTQLVFHPGDSHEKANITSFWIHSWLQYGLTIVREAVWTNTEDIVTSLTSDGGAILENPCAPKEFEVEFSGKRRLRGMGDGKSCIRLVQSFLRSRSGIYTNEDEQERANEELIWGLGGVRPPPVVGEFLALSGYYFVFDFARALLPRSALSLSWPSPSLDEMEEAVVELCGLTLTEIHERVALLEGGYHPFTASSQFADRCVEAAYIVTLWRRGFGMTDSNVTFALDVRGHEVDWTLGYAISEGFKSAQPPGVPVVNATGSLPINVSIDLSSLDDRTYHLYWIHPNGSMHAQGSFHLGSEKIKIVAYEGHIFEVQTEVESSIRRSVRFTAKSVDQQLRVKYVDGELSVHDVEHTEDNQADMDSNLDGGSAHKTRSVTKETDLDSVSTQKDDTETKETGCPMQHSSNQNNPHLTAFNPPQSERTLLGDIFGSPSEVEDTMTSNHSETQNFSFRQNSSEIEDTLSRSNHSEIKDIVGGGNHFEIEEDDNAAQSQVVKLQSKLIDRSSPVSSSQSLLMVPHHAFSKLLGHFKRAYGSTKSIVLRSVRALGHFSLIVLRLLRDLFKGM